MNYLDIQVVCESCSVPGAEQLQHWVDVALTEFDQDTELVLRIVDEQESAELNARYRHKEGPTNILSFPADLPEGVDLDLLGDLVICAPVLEKEAQQQHKAIFDHWAHIVVHGVLHLLGYDHIDDDEAEIMENKEIAILNGLNISNPYAEVSE
ncbi:MAG: rRNA maturation RNase YbeY [Methylococcales bacterium]